MAKKGGVQKLQEEINTDEEFEHFLERPGLLVLDVYSEWCGPCLGMVGSLRKIKMELGGDNLQLAICKADTISYLNRFCKKSEPTWLFVTGGKAINIMFGTDVPKLMELITKELQLVASKTPRTIYEITELQPIEVDQLRIKTEAIQKQERILSEAKEKKRTDYLKSVTNTILENMPDIGVTVFGPHINRDMFKKLSEPAEHLKMQCKDRKVVTVTIDEFNIVNFACKNPLPIDVIEQLHEKELLMCFWKVDDSLGTVPNILMTYAHELTKETVVPVDDFNDEEQIVPPIITPIKIKVEVEVQDGDDWEAESSEEEKHPPKKGKSVINTTLGDQESHVDLPIDDFDGEEEGEEEGGEGDFVPALPLEMPFDFDLDADLDDLGEEEEEDEVVDDTPKKQTRLKTVKLPAVWVPIDKRTHATLIYVFFRGQTSGFLPPDPKPEAPHVIMAFDAYKRRDLINIIERNKDDIPLYGYFTSDDPEETQLLANTNEKYAEVSRQATDKIILKVNKVRSNTMLALVSYGPTYVSPNTDVGHEEALKFFPENYKSEDHEEAEQLADEKPKKRKKSKKDIEPGAITEDSKSLQEATKADGVDEQQQPESAEQVEAVPTEEEAHEDEGEIPPEGEQQPATSAEGTEVPPDEVPTEGTHTPTKEAEPTDIVTPKDDVAQAETQPLVGVAPAEADASIEIEAKPAEALTAVEAEPDTAPQEPLREADQAVATPDTAAPPAETVEEPLPQEETAAPAAPEEGEQPPVE